MTLDPQSLDGVCASIGDVGDASARRDRAERRASALEARRASTARAARRGRALDRCSCSSGPIRPSPPGTGSPTWWRPAVALPCSPTVVTTPAGSVGTPCGRRPRRSCWSRRAATTSTRPRRWPSSSSPTTGCRAGAEVWAVDADSHFVRPGPRLIDGVETVAQILHPRPAAGRSGSPTDRIEDVTWTTAPCTWSGGPARGTTTIPTPTSRRTSRSTRTSIRSRRCATSLARRHPGRRAVPLRAREVGDGGEPVTPGARAHHDAPARDDLRRRRGTGNRRCPPRGVRAASRSHLLAALPARPPTCTTVEARSPASPRVKHVTHRPDQAFRTSRTQRAGWHQVTSVRVRCDARELLGGARIHTVRRPPVRPVRGQHLVRRGRVRRPRPDHVRPRYRVAELRRRAHGRGPERRLPRHRAAHAPALGSHPGPAVLRLRCAAGGGTVTVIGPHQEEGPLATVFRQVMSPPVLPDHPGGAARRRRLRVGGQRRLRAQRRQGAVALGAPHRPHARLPGRDGRRVGRVPLRPRSRHRARRRRRLRAPRRARALRRRRPPHPRRAAHRRGVRDQAHVGALHDRVRDPRRQGGGRAAARAVPPLSVARRREPRHHLCATRRDFSARINGPEVFAAADGMRHELHSPNRSTSQEHPLLRREFSFPTTSMFRSVLGHFATGVTIITAMDGDEPVGIAANSFTSLSLDPPLDPVLRRAHVVHVAAHRGGGNVRGEHPRRRPRGALQPLRPEGRRPLLPTPWRIGVSGAPVLEEAIAYLDCRFEAEYPGGDHKIIVGRVLDLDMREGARPLLFYKGGYQRMHEAEAAVTADDVALAARVVVAIILVVSGVGQAARARSDVPGQPCGVRRLRVDHVARRVGVARLRARARGAAARRRRVVAELARAGDVRRVHRRARATDRAQRPSTVQLLRRRVDDARPVDRVAAAQHVVPRAAR